MFAFFKLKLPIWCHTTRNLACRKYYFKGGGEVKQSFQFCFLAAGISHKTVQISKTKPGSSSGVLPPPLSRSKNTHHRHNVELLTLPVLIQPRLFVIVADHTHTHTPLFNRDDPAYSSTVQASLSGILPQNSAVTDYATNGALLVLRASDYWNHRYI